MPEDYLNPVNLITFVKAETLENKMVVHFFLCHMILEQGFIKLKFLVKNTLKFILGHTKAIY